MNSTDNKPYLNVKDHSVSGEEFQLVYNQQMDLLETFPQPSEDKLGDYYESEDYISHTDAKRNAFEKAYHFIKSMALKRKLKLINSFNSEERKLLDVGCGTGDFLKVAKDNHWMVYGIEPNENARRIANEKTNNAVFDIEQLLKFETQSFDVITLWHVLEHLPNLKTQIGTFEALLKPNGRLIIAVPNYKSFDANYYKNFWAAFDVPRHLWHFSQTSISKLVGTKSMDVEKTTPMIFDAYYVSLLSEKYKNGSMNLFKAFWIGWTSNWKAKQSTEYSSMIYTIKKR
ncbi:class I SAM-dependent methyltransferase [Psychroserpens burtonensis]|uniref:Class I SAM-dependent methyltransferase n=1 Tax=Psychroserpens burtonensis TaxID=49278 RepID=A0A5C7BB86_9FLAO|nr:class I SAM-dependent methyltransferase [Psychroserpens burtonensis]TXE19172.1 class I SAM-dependent methyltransferase [Psychroserpens burtonensis]